MLLDHLLRYTYSSQALKVISSGVLTMQLKWSKFAHCICQILLATSDRPATIVAQNLTGAIEQAWPR